MSKISELTDGGSLLPTDTLIAVRSGANVKVVNDTINVTTLNPDQINMGDNEQIRLGNSQDLLIYHDGTNSLINDAGTGSLQLQQGGSTKLEVTTTGIDVTGSVTADSVGIGETNPSANLHISTDNTSTTNTATFRLEDTDTTTLGNQGIGRIEFYGNDSSGAGAGVKAAIEAFGEDGSGRTTLKFSTANAVANDVGAMYINSSGNVGIGESSPTFDVQIRRAAEVNLGLSYTGQTTSELAAEASAVTALKSSGNLRFVTNTSTEAIRIDNSGNVGIGTTSPNTTLHVSSTTTTKSVVETTGVSSDALIEFTKGQGSGNTWSMGIDHSNSSAFSLAYLSNGSPSLTTHGVLTVNTSGNVGIGTASPATILDCRENSTGGSTQIRVYNTDNSNTTTQTAALFLAPDSRGNGALIYAEKENADFSTSAGRDVSLVFSPVLNNSQTEAMRITSAGNVGIGTASPDTLTHLFGNTGASLGLKIEANGWSNDIRLIRSAGENDFYITNNYDTAATAADSAANGTSGLRVGRGFLSFHSGASGAFNEAMRIDSSGNVLAGNDGGLDLGSSSQRFKDLYLSGNIDISTSSDPQTAFVDVAKTINDDAVYSFTPDKPIGIIYIYGRNANYSQAFGMVSYRTTATAYCVEVLDPNSFISTSTSVLTGTSGTDGQITISAVSSDGKIYIENRINNTISIGVHVSGQ